HFLREIESVFVKDVLRRPCALKTHADRALRLDDRRRSDCCRCGGACETRGFQEISTSGGKRTGVLADWFLRHSIPPWKPSLGDGSRSPSRSLRRAFA